MSVEAAALFLIAGLCNNSTLFRLSGLLLVSAHQVGIYAEGVIAGGYMHGNRQALCTSTLSTLRAKHEVQGNGSSCTCTPFTLDSVSLLVHLLVVVMLIVKIYAIATLPEAPRSRRAKWLLCGCYVASMWGLCGTSASGDTAAPCVVL